MCKLHIYVQFISLLIFYLLCNLHVYLYLLYVIYIYNNIYQVFVCANDISAVLSVLVVCWWTDSGSGWCLQAYLHGGGPEVMGTLQQVMKHSTGVNKQPLPLYNFHL